MSKKNKAFVAFYILILVLVIMIGLGISIYVLTGGEQKILTNITRSNQAYYLAEAGAEDALLRLSKNKNWINSYYLNIDNSTATITITDMVGGSRTIFSEGNVFSRLRKIATVYEVSAETVNFYYGAQVGNGGIILEDGSTINGNVFSNGSIIGGPNTEITGTAKVAQTGNHMDGVVVGEDAFVDVCINSTIGDTLTCASSTNCTAAATETLLEEIATGSLPVSDAQITEWKNKALSGGTTSDYILQVKEAASLGPIKIEGNLTVISKAQLFITGTIWVTGSINIEDSAIVRLDQDTYGSLGGTLISDGVITLLDSAKALGTGETGSYLMVISTNPGNPAITIQDAFEADILYTSDGWIEIQNTADVRQVTGYGLHLYNDAEIFYEIGLQDASFSTGPGGGWRVTSWKEVK